MESTMIIDVVILFSALIFLRTWWRYWRSSTTTTGKGLKNLPPGPRGWPLVRNLIQVILQRRHFIFIIRDIRAKYGPIFTMQMGQRTMVIVTESKLIHEALVQRGPAFASRPADSPIRLIFSVGKCAINSSEYGPLWRTLRKNFVTELINPTRLSHFNDEMLLHREFCDHQNHREYCDHHNHRDFVLEEPKNKAAYSSWSEKTFLK